MERVIAEMGSIQQVTQLEMQAVLTHMSLLFQSVTAISQRVTEPHPSPIPPEADAVMMQASTELEAGQRRITEFAAQQPLEATTPAVTRAAAAGGA